jgi:hypothetical protein
VQPRSWRRLACWQRAPVATWQRRRFRCALAIASGHAAAFAFDTWAPDPFELAITTSLGRHGLAKFDGTFLTARTVVVSSGTWRRSEDEWRQLSPTDTARASLSRPSREGFAGFDPQAACGRVPLSLGGAHRAALYSDDLLKLGHRQRA